MSLNVIFSGSLTWSFVTGSISVSLFGIVLVLCWQTDSLYGHLTKIEIPIKKKKKKKKSRLEKSILVAFLAAITAFHAKISAAHVATLTRQSPPLRPHERWSQLRKEREEGGGATMSSVLASCGRSRAKQKKTKKGQKT